jgi:hypothetical protein
MLRAAAPGDSGGEKTTAIDLFHTIDFFLTMSGLALLSLF